MMKCNRNSFLFFSGNDHMIIIPVYQIPFIFRFTLSKRNWKLSKKQKQNSINDCVHYFRFFSLNSSSIWILNWQSSYFLYLQVFITMEFLLKFFSTFANLSKIRLYFIFRVNRYIKHRVETLKTKTTSKLLYDG